MTALATCPRCGLVRHTHDNDLSRGRDRMCRDCKEVDPTWPTPLALEVVLA